MKPGREYLTTDISLKIPSLTKNKIVKALVRLKNNGVVKSDIIHDGCHEVTAWRLAEKTAAR